MPAPAITRTTPHEEQIISPVAPTIIIGDIDQKYYWSSQHKMGMLRGLNCEVEYERKEWKELPDNPDKRATARDQHQAWKAKYTTEQQKLLNRAYLELGQPNIRFHYVSGPDNGQGQARTGWVWYATNSDAQAFVIRWHMEHVGFDWQFIREVPQDTYLKVGDRNYANNDIARRMAFEYMEETGNPIEPVAKAS